MWLLFGQKSTEPPFFFFSCNKITGELFSVRSWPWQLRDRCLAPNLLETWNKVAFLYIKEKSFEHRSRSRGLLDVWNKTKQHVTLQQLKHHTRQKKNKKQKIYDSMFPSGSALFCVSAERGRHGVWRSQFSSQPHHGNARPFLLIPFQVFQLLKALQISDFIPRAGKINASCKNRTSPINYDHFGLWFIFQMPTFNKLLLPM